VLRRLAQRRSALGNAIVVPVIDRLRGNPDRRDPRVSKLQFNTLARFTRQLRDLYHQLGVRGAIAFIRTSCAAPWFDPARMRELLAKPFLLQLE